MMQVRRSVPKIWFKHGQGTPGEFTHHEELTRTDTNKYEAATNTNQQKSV